jgi:hypothetical protein
MIVKKIKINNMCQFIIINSQFRKIFMVHFLLKHFLIILWLYYQKEDMRNLRSCNNLKKLYKVKNLFTKFMRIFIKICQKKQLDTYFIWPIKKNIIILKKLELRSIHSDGISRLHRFVHNSCCQALLIIQNALLTYQWDLNHCSIMKLSK